MSFGELVKAVATRERAKGETLDHFGELCVIEERATALREAIPRKDWTPPGREMSEYHHPVMEKLNRAQAQYRRALADIRLWAVSEAEFIRDRLEMDEDE